MVSQNKDISMIIDSSAVIAILLGEPEVLIKLEAASVRLISAANALEASIVIGAKKGKAGLEYLDQMFYEAKINIVLFDEEQYKSARKAWWTYGKGREHPASLNFGDCFAYALAKNSNQPLLFKGDDFLETDLIAA